MDGNLSRCPYCSLMCPVAIERRAHGVTLPAYTNPDEYSGGHLCYRGHYLAPLLCHPNRLIEATLQSAPEQQTQSEIHHQAARKLQEASRNKTLGTLISGNLPVEEIHAGGHFFQSILPARSTSIFLPPADEAMMRQLRGGRYKPGLPTALEKADIILAVGDVLGTHPVLAGRLMDRLESKKPPILINLDSMKGRTMRFARIGLTTQTGMECWGIEALLTLVNHSKKPETKACYHDALAVCELEDAAVKEAAEAIRPEKGKTVVLLLTIPQGHCRRPNELATLTGLLARTIKATLVPLLTYANAPGAFAVSHTLGTTPPAHWLKQAMDGSFTTLFIADVDLFGMLPKNTIQTIRAKVETLITAAAMPGPTTELSDIVLPLAFGFEMTGHYMNCQGTLIKRQPLGMPPGHAVALSAMLHQIDKLLLLPEVTRMLPDEFALELASVSAADRTKPELLIPEPANSYTLTARTETLDLYEGAVSRQMDWPLGIEPIPVVLIHPEKARALKLAGNDRILLTRGTHEQEFLVRISDAVWPDTLALSATIPETRHYFQWELNDDGIEITPVPVEIRPAVCEVACG